MHDKGHIKAQQVGMLTRTKIPVQSARKFSAVLGATSVKSCIIRSNSDVKLITEFTKQQQQRISRGCVCHRFQAETIMGRCNTIPQKPFSLRDLHQLRHPKTQVISFQSSSNFTNQDGCQGSLPMQTTMSADRRQLPHINKYTKHLTSRNSNHKYPLIV